MSTYICIPGLDTSPSYTQVNVIKHGPFLEKPALFGDILKYISHLKKCNMNLEDIRLISHKKTNAVCVIPLV